MTSDVSYGDRHYRNCVFSAVLKLQTLFSIFIKDIRIILEIFMGWTV